MTAQPVRGQDPRRGLLPHSPTIRTYIGQWFAKAGLPSTTKAGLESSEVQNDTFTRNFATAVGANSEPDPFWVYPQFAQIQQVLATQVQAAVVGKVSPKDALTTAKEQMEALAR
jgi:multiple sugar transport system substrate-binding protein